MLVTILALFFWIVLPVGESLAQGAVSESLLQFSSQFSPDKVSGDLSALKSLSLSGDSGPVVFVSFADLKHWEAAVTFVESLEHLGVKKRDILIVCLDSACVDRCRLRGIPSVSVHASNTGKWCMEQQKTSSARCQIGVAKTAVTLDILRSGRGALVSDSDVFFYQHPIRALVPKNPKAHLYISRESYLDTDDPGKAYLNYGLFFARPAPQTISFFEAVASEFRETLEWDQRVFGRKAQENVFEQRRLEALLALPESVGGSSWEGSGMGGANANTTTWEAEGKGVGVQGGGGEVSEVVGESRGSAREGPAPTTLEAGELQVVPNVSRGSSAVTEADREAMKERLQNLLIVDILPGQQYAAFGHPEFLPKKVVTFHATCIEGTHTKAFFAVSRYGAPNPQQHYAPSVRTVSLAPLPIQAFSTPAALDAALKVMAAVAKETGRAIRLDFGGGMIGVGQVSIDHLFSLGVRVVDGNFWVRAAQLTGRATPHVVQVGGPLDAATLERMRTEALNPSADEVMLHFPLPTEEGAVDSLVGPLLGPWGGYRDGKFSRPFTCRTVDIWSQKYEWPIEAIKKGMAGCMEVCDGAKAHRF